MRTAPLALAALVSATPVAATVAPAAADSCWNHNGSIMRLQAQGNRRQFYYERPRGTLARAGVQPGTLLFNGTKRGNSYEGTSRVFSRFCPGAPQEYYVQGPVSNNQLKVTLYGTRDRFQRCEPTGTTTTDTLVFTYAYDC